MDKLAEKVNDHIQDWSEGRPKLVVAIDGYTGVGKTTLNFSSKIYVLATAKNEKF